MKNFQNQNQQKPMNIGVFGFHPHAGVTWITVLLAQYLSGICGLNVAVIENSQKRDLISLSFHEEPIEEGLFKIHNVTYSTQNEKVCASKLSRSQFDCYVYDLGCNYSKSREIIQACDRTLLLYTMTPWYFDQVKAKIVLERDYGDPEHLTFVGNMISKERRKLSMSLMKKTEFIDYEPDLFQPSKQSIQVFHNIVWN